MSSYITRYNCICNIGRSIDEVYHNIINGLDSNFLFTPDIINGKTLCVATIDDNDLEIKNPDYNLKCNRILLEVLQPFYTYIESLIQLYGPNRIGIVVATTNSGVEEYELSKNEVHSQIGNPALFLKEYFNLTGYYSSVSTACTSGIKAFSIANNLLESNILDAVIVTGVDTLAKVPLYGFSSLEVLSSKKTNPLSKNRLGINIGEGAAAFIVEKEKQQNCIEILGIGETSDTYHSTTPDPEGIEAIRAIEIALNNAKLKPEDVDYINLHGTGTIANDLTEAKAVNHFFKKTYVSSTKPFTGHCLGAAACIETALCCELINKGGYFNHIYDGEYDELLPKMNISMPPTKTKICMNNAFGFGGTNAIMIMGGCE